MVEAIRYRDESGQVYMWETPDGQQSFSIDDDDRCVMIESPFGSPRTTDLEIDFEAFQAGIGHDGVRMVFGDVVVREILGELAVTTQAGQAVKRTMSRRQRRPLRKMTGGPSGRR
ncbi:MAG: hypothetical protein JRI55_33505 [Deltaproteobacteria bacterium]|jgi:hypothetical protein|nr:hypothetical protein [Deltaproteobacteria bacterium]